MNENGYLKETVQLEHLIDNKWIQLDTEIIEEAEGTVSFKSELEHFSFFAITAKSELEKSWFRNLIPPSIGTKEFVLFGFFIVIAVLLLIYFLVRRKSSEFEM